MWKLTLTDSDLSDLGVANFNIILLIQNERRKGKQKKREKEIIRTFG